MNEKKRQLLRYVLGDYVMLNLGWLLFTLVRFYYLTPETVSLTVQLAKPAVIGGQIFFPLMMMALYWLSGYYNAVFFKSRLDELTNTLWVTFAGSIIVFFAALIDDEFRTGNFGYHSIVILFCLWFVPVYVLRVLFTNAAAARIRRREIAFDTLIVGTGRNAINLVSRLERAERGNGFNIVGYVNCDPARELHPDIDKPVYTLDDLPEAVERLGIKRLIVVPQPGGMRETAQLVNSLFPTDCRIYITAELYGLILSRPRMEDVVGEPLIDITSPNATPATINIKRVCDVFLSSLALIVLSPVYLAIAACIRRDSPGPVLYRQERIGFHKRPFHILKFRTMRTDAEASGPALSGLDDPRITHVGHFLRKYRLDELPQFWNVLRGEMSLVGPRPEREYYIRRIVERAPYYSLVHQVRPGITSWGMVKYGYATSVDQMIERLRYDIIYLENVSLAVDLKILFYTVNTVLTGKGL